MSKILKVILGVVGVTLLLLVGAGVYLSRNLPQIIKDVVESQAPQITGTDVTLAGVQIIYGTGRVIVQDLVIKNPVGFRSSHAFWLNKLVIQINIPSVFEDVLVIDELAIEKANIIAEQTGSSLETNLQVIANSSKNTGDRSKKASTSETPAKKIIIREFRFTGNSIDLISQQWGNRTIPVPDLILKDIGAKEGGLTPDQLSQRIIKMVTRQANQAAKNELKRLAKDTLGGKIKDTLSSFLGGSE